MRKDGGKDRWLKFFLIIAFGLAIGNLAWLRADTSASATFSIELKEWLVLEIKSAASGFSDTGNFQAQGQTQIISGQPLQVRVLLSVVDSKSVALKGIIYPEEEQTSSQRALIWRGQGDIQGQGLALTGQENTFAVWQGAGLKTGSLVFLEPADNSDSVYKAVFTLSAI
ncbi:MAG: hypothetical protein N3G18_07260 [Candidatus Saccharicenans sp.]|nr:hypothetical protein [Candidatus Saccharicenans sp.]